MLTKLPPSTAELRALVNLHWNSYAYQKELIQVLTTEQANPKTESERKVDPQDEWTPELRNDVMHRLRLGFEPQECPPLHTWAPVNLERWGRLADIVLHLVAEKTRQLRQSLRECHNDIALLSTANNSYANESWQASSTITRLTKELEAARNGTIDPEVAEIAKRLPTNGRDQLRSAAECKAINDGITYLRKLAGLA